MKMSNLIIDKSSYIYENIKGIKNNNKNSGITLIALVVSIVIMLILAGTAIGVLMGEKGLINQAISSSFIAEMTAIREQVEMKKAAELLDSNVINMSTTFSISLTKENTDDFEKTLIREIVFYRAKKGLLNVIQEITSTEVNLEYAEQYYQLHPEEIVEGLYYIDPEYANGKEHYYVYDSLADIAYKIKHTKISGNKVHSLEFLLYYQTGIFNTENPESVMQEGEFINVGGISYYSPNFKNFTLDYSYVVYYNPEDLSDTYEVKMRDFIANGSERVITNDSKDYIVYDYAEKIWANVKTVHNGMISWWVWIPRFSYTLNGADSNIDITFVDTATNASPSFTVNGSQLQGLWISKYEPTLSNYEATNQLPYYIPDMSGFDPETTYIEIYDKDSNSFIEEIKLADIQDLKALSQDKLWFDYDSKIWANVKTTANEHEAWWVWVPRYAYSITNTQTDIKFIDTNDIPLDASSLDNYTVHNAFNVDGNKLRGLWVSKYEPTLGEEIKVNQNVNKPDISGFNADNTYIEVYNSEGTTTIKEIKLSDVLTNGSIDDNKLANRLGNDKWYDYTEKIWANIKVVSNGKTSWWTWIPRYSYSMVNTQINVVFTDTNDESLTEEVEVTADMIPHNAFNVDGKKLKGIWISKYEPTGTAATADEVSEFMEDSGGT